MPLRRWLLPPFALLAPFDGWARLPDLRLDAGRMPWAIASADASIGVRNPGLASAVPLDANGEPGRPIAVDRDGGALRFDLPSDALYVALRAG